MPRRLLVTVLAVSLAAFAQQTLTVSKLYEFIKSCTGPQAKGRYTDKQIADLLLKFKVTERLEDRTIEDIQAMGIGPKTLQALDAIRDRTKDLAAPGTIQAALPPKPIPPPSSEEQGALIDEARDYALNYSGNLPDFICTQVTKRYGALKPGTRGGGPATDDPHWQKFDELTIRLSYFSQHEDYKLILHNSTPTQQDLGSVGGSTSYGDFGTMMRKIFERGTEARFEWDHWGTLRGKRVMAFRYHVDQERSEYHIVVPDRKLDIITAYTGLVELDKDTHKVMRITLDAVELPASFPIKTAQTVLDYDYVDLSGHSFLLPLKGQVFSSSSDIVTRNDESFHNYRKYSADATITFGDVDTKDIPDEKTKETIDPGQKPVTPDTTTKKKK
jgi:hypothetical protein